MIDKKPLRVTNEQAIAVKNMINGRPFIYASGNDIPADWFAADLLDARELIDKQEVIIKEMWDFINGLRCEVSDCTKEASILEKTKDYV